jgi:membrane protein implicated in regulation of membrane protease activity
MKSSTSQYLYSVFRQGMHEFRYLGNKFLQVLLRTPLPRILIICIGLALLITIVPLLLTLFVVFLLLKLLLLIVVLTMRKHRAHPSELDYQRRNYQRK